MNVRPFLATVACLGFSSLAVARGPELDLPSFVGLQQKATESVDITLGQLALGIMGGLVDEHDRDSAAMKKTLRGLTAVKIRSYRFDSDFAYAKADIDGVRSQLSGAGWSQLARVRDRKTNEDVDVYVALEGAMITGFAVVDSKPREFTIVNIVGKVDVEQVSKLQLQLGLPDVGVARLLPHMQ